MSRTVAYEDVHVSPKGPGDARPTAIKVLEDQGLIGALPNLVVLVTGASAGIGTETARAAYATGAKVFMTSRTTDKGEKVVRDIAGDNKDGRLVLLPPFDLANQSSVRRGAEELLKQSGGKLNVLINNAGLSTSGVELTEDGWERQLTANHLGPLLLFHLLKDALLSSSTPEFHSRVVNVSSVSHRRATKVAVDDPAFKNQKVEGWFTAYSQSKLGNIYMANEIERRWGSRGLHAFSLQPGGVAAETFRDIWTQEEIDAAYKSGDGAPFTKTAAQGAATSIWAAFGKEWEGRGGKYLENLAEAPVVDAPEEKWGDWWVPGRAPWAYDEEAAKYVWAESMKLLKLKDKD